MKEISYRENGRSCRGLQQRYQSTRSTTTVYQKYRRIEASEGTAPYTYQTDSFFFNYENDGVQSRDDALTTLSPAICD